jgi:hypothetical protein
LQDFLKNLTIMLIFEASQFYATTHNQPNDLKMLPLPLSSVAAAVDMATTTVKMALVIATTEVMAVAMAVATMAALAAVTAVTAAAATKMWQQQRWQQVQTTIN